jgi:predicted small lipoprotein YifL
MRVLIVLCFISILSACGQKGPLFLPGEDQPEVKTPMETEERKKPNNGSQSS